MIGVAKVNDKVVVAAGKVLAAKRVHDKKYDVKLQIPGREKPVTFHFWNNAPKEGQDTTPKAYADMAERKKLREGSMITIHGRFDQDSQTSANGYSVSYYLEPMKDRDTGEVIKNDNKHFVFGVVNFVSEANESGVASAIVYTGSDKDGNAKSWRISLFDVDEEKLAKIRPSETEGKATALFKVYGEDIYVSEKTLEAIDEAKCTEFTAVGRRVPASAAKTA